MTGDPMVDWMFEGCVVLVIIIAGLILAMIAEQNNRGGEIMNQIELAGGSTLSSLGRLVNIKKQKAPTAAELKAYCQAMATHLGVATQWMRR